MTRSQHATERLSGFLLHVGREADEKLTTNESDRYMERVLDFIPTGIVIIDEKTHEIIYANTTALEIIGASKDVVFGKVCHKFICPSDEGECPISDLGQTIDKSERVLLRASGEKLPILKTVKKTIWRGRNCLIESFIDIVERKEVEERIKRVAEEWKKTFDAISDVVFILDTDFRFVKVNKALCNVLKKRPEEVIGKRCFEVLHGTNEPWPNCPHEKTLITKKATVAEINDPNLGTLLITNSPIFDERGELIGAVHVVKDIGKLKKIEEELQREREILELVTENMRVGLVVVSRDFRVLWTNKVEEEKKHANVKGEHCYKVFNNQENVCLGCPVKEIFETGKDEAVSEQLVEDCGGKKAWIALFASALRDENGNVTSALEVVVPITERKEMEEKLKQYSEHLEELVQKRTEELLESEKRYSILVEEASAGVAIIQDGKLVFVNKRCLEVGGYSKEELIGLPFEKIVDEKYRQIMMERYIRKLQGAPPATFEIELIAKNGKRVPAEIGGSLISYQGRPAVLVILRDISERKQLEEQRLKLEKLATIAELATMIGHDLMNPMQAIENAAFILRNELANLQTSDKAIKALQVIQNSINYADKIVNDLKEFAVAEKLTLKKADINAIVEEALSQVQPPENVKIVKEFGRIPEINVDKDRLKRVFINLAMNGIQAMEKNGGTLEVSTKKAKDCVLICFKDTGMGMPKEHVKKLFNSIFTTKAKGMGLGLMICKRLVESHGGSIHVKSEVGKGSVFTVKLPINKNMSRR
ncbi:MAG: PAS domain-containing sensor histidine kinase [Candidatus Bathyarchaeales archaeon]